MLPPLLKRSLAVGASRIHAGSKASITRFSALHIVSLRRSFTSTPSVWIPPAKTTEDAAKSKEKAKAKPETLPRKKKADGVAKTTARKKVTTRKTKKVVVKKPKVLKRVKKPEPKKPKAPLRLKAPPKPRTGYFRFYHEQIAEMKRDGTYTNLMGSSKIAGERWKVLDEETKEKYVAQYYADMPAYLERKAEFFKTLDHKLLKEVNKERVKKGYPRIRMPLAAGRREPSLFAKFYQEFRKTPQAAAIIEEVSGVGRFQLQQSETIMKAAAQAWNELSQEEKDKYKPTS